MNELGAFGTHARVMATADHKPECAGTPERIADRARRRVGYLRLFREAPPEVQPIDPCPGCVSDADRALWARLADEVDAYLNHDADEGLFA